MSIVAISSTIGSLGDEEAMAHSPLEYLYVRFSGYIQARRNDPGRGGVDGQGGFRRQTRARGGSVAWRSRSASAPDKATAPHR